ncbi:hypothetical protein ONZ51_g7557 [Trametes cubensis]|uniref:Uncharacterized protein n=1 Tax=Trametes cubensis TaxID=1111947 RepID=A0AAD7TQA4_9APHY|nr:hypothetical protein ONZ51_g7557 [Trametes cubensis]
MPPTPHLTITSKMSQRMLEILHVLLNSQLTRTGEFYPADKLSSMDILHAAARVDAPYALSTLPLQEARWDFKYPSLRDAILSMNGKPIPIRLICVLENVAFNKNPPYIDVHPLYDNDAVTGNAILGDPAAFDPEFDYDREHHPIRLSIEPRVQEHADGSQRNSLNQSKYILDVFDNTQLRFEDRTRVVVPAMLKRNDLVIATCHLRLHADPRNSGPSYDLVVRELRLVHLAVSYIEDL